MLNKKVFIFVTMIFFPITVEGGNYPIIFVHGNKGGGNPKDALYDWNSQSYTSCMQRIIQEGYGGYSAGEPLNNTVDSTPKSTCGDTKKIYNFSYYLYGSDETRRGAIGSNDNLMAEGVDEIDGYDYKIDNEYKKNIEHATWLGILHSLLLKY